MPVLGEARVLRSSGGVALLKPLNRSAFRRLWGAAALSMLADQAFLVSLTWLVLELTGAGSGLGVVLAVASVPGLLLMPLGGVASDRLSAAGVAAAAGAGRTLLLACMAALVFADATRVWHVYVLAGCLSALDALYYPASMALVPRLAKPEDLEAANGLTQGAEQVSSILGPALAGSLVATLGLGASFAVKALLFSASTVIFLTLIRAHASPLSTSTAGTEEAQDGSTLAALVEGVRYAWGDPVIRAIMLILVGINLAMVGPLYVGGAILAETRLGGAGAFGTLVAGAGVGALLGALGAGSLGRIRRRGLIELSLTAALGVFVGAFAFAPNLLVAGSLAVAVGAAASFLAVVNISWLQERSEPDVTGRVMSLAMLSTMALDPISYLAAGAFVGLNLTVVFLAAGALLILTALLGATSRTMRTAD
ncbi:MAG: MFS transporter [Actinomycetota bacterium]|nr:MFS transporter [Actinomycetota bacterium]